MPFLHLPCRRPSPLLVHCEKQGPRRPAMRTEELLKCFALSYLALRERKTLSEIDHDRLASRVHFFPRSIPRFLTGESSIL